MMESIIPKSVLMIIHNQSRRCLKMTCRFRMCFQMMILTRIRRRKLRSSNKGMLFSSVKLLKKEISYLPHILETTGKVMILSHGNRSINAWWKSKTTILLGTKQSVSTSCHAVPSAADHSAAARSPKASLIAPKTLSKSMISRWLWDRHCSTRSTQSWRFQNQRGKW